MLLALQVLCSLIGWLALYRVFSLSQRAPEWNCRTDNTVLQTSTLAICLGYFLFDMAWCLHYGSEGPLMLAHHASSIIAMLLVLVTGKSGCSELTNPLLQSRWFLRQVGRYDGLLGDVVDVLFITLFATLRIAIGSVLFYCVMASPRPSPVIKAGAVVMYIVSWFFMVNVTKFGVKKSCTKYKQWADKRRLDEGSEKIKDK
ncbi:hypothetical protein CRUP_027037 [Coryphaenoides rupestris]|nr:hypothetical protein CRUP_027037 [Coryphaenoides rupestris]